MKKEYLCTKDWVLNGKLIFKKGTSYKGIVIPNKFGKQVEIKNEKGDNVYFYSGSKYFKI